MIRSMTGYGSAEAVENSVSYVGEVRSVNNRYLKLSIRLPDYLTFAEPVVEKLLRDEVSRGSVTFNLKTRQDMTTAVVPINRRVLESYLAELGNAAVPEGITKVVDLATLATLPGVLEPVELSDEVRNRVQAIIEDVTKRSIAALRQMRELEGNALRDDLLLCCRAIVQEVEAIAEHAPKVIEEYHGRLQTRVSVLMKQAGLDLEKDSLMREVAVFAERCDVSEEITRLRSHVMLFMSLCDGDDQVGRKMDFLTQELLREANTIASKSNNAVITRRTLDIKTLVDRVREQVQNVE